MSYRLDAAGQASASLALSVAAPVARAFGRRGITAIEQAGGALTGAEITGTDTAGDMATARRSSADARTDLADVDSQLARRDLPVSLRRDLLARRNDLIVARRQGVDAAADTQARLMATPIAFTYHAGTGIGLTARLSEAAQAGYASLTWTLATSLTLLAYLSPPLALLLVLMLFWHRIGRRWWRRAFPSIDE